MDVRWLDVPMAHTLLMQVEHNLDELLAKRAGFALLQAFRVSDNFLQAWPLKKLQNQVRPNEIQRDHDTTVLAQAEQVEPMLAVNLFFARIGRRTPGKGKKRLGVVRNYNICRRESICWHLFVCGTNCFSFLFFFFARTRREYVGTNFIHHLFMEIAENVKFAISDSSFSAVSTISVDAISQLKESCKNLTLEISENSWEIFTILRDFPACLETPKTWDVSDNFSENLKR